MKKLIAISVVFALVAGTAFAVDLGGELIGTVTVLEGNNVKDSTVDSSGNMDRFRVSGSGANDDGTFGADVRIDGSTGGPGLPWDGTAIPGIYGSAWWKPIDQFKLWIGNNGGDGFFGKDGLTRWMFYQRITDTGVTMGGENAWGGGNGAGFNFGAAFFGGDGGDNAFRATISPADIVDINLKIPFFNGGEVGDVIADLVAQVDLKFDFGNIAVTYQGDHNDATNGQAYVYFNLGSVENLSLDVGLGLTIPGDVEGQPIAAGLGVKYDVNDAFGLKFRTVASFGGDDEKFGLLADVLPYYAISDTVKAFLSAGVTMLSDPNVDDPNIGFHINPYIWVGQEWGPTFWAGFKLWTDGSKGGGEKGDDGLINWSVPIAIGVSF
jgi:hypothetical protein